LPLSGSPPLFAGVSSGRGGAKNKQTAVQERKKNVVGEHDREGRARTSPRRALKIVCPSPVLAAESADLDEGDEGGTAIQLLTPVTREEGRTGDELVAQLAWRDLRFTPARRLVS
jgi:hypothetical protein